MKTIKKGKQIKRVTDAEASKRVNAQGWAYCPKWEAVKDPETQNKKKGTGKYEDSLQAVAAK